MTHAEIKIATAKEALIEAGVTNAAYIKVLSRDLANQATVETVDGKRIVKIGDKSILDVFKADPDSPHYIAAVANGGNIIHLNGGGGSSDTKTMKNSDFSQLNPKDSAAFFASGGRVVDD